MGVPKRHGCGDLERDEHIWNRISVDTGHSYEGARRESQASGLHLSSKHFQINMSYKQFLKR